MAFNRIQELTFSESSDGRLGFVWQGTPLNVLSVPSNSINPDWKKYVVEKVTLRVRDVLLLRTSTPDAAYHYEAFTRDDKLAWRQGQTWTLVAQSAGDASVLMEKKGEAQYEIKVIIELDPSQKGALGKK